ncbi:alpha/beta fold hydrolase [Rathayibacter sp. YIM 133350]|uniref:alpha/beta fold hydrolase n=1 Tax=Rathayibacter sp. YIM 133350 TaxID=3131992 RepID=UPI00307F1AF5
MSDDARTYTDAAGVRVHYDVWPVERPRGVAQVVHGVGEHAGRYAHVARALNEAGFSVYIDDHHGHGRTGLEQHGGDVGKLGRLGPGGLRAAVASVYELSGIIRAENPGVPLVLIGHSWGSFIAQIILNAHAADYAAAVLTGTAYRMPGYLAAGDLNRRHRQLGTTGAEWLSRDPAVAQAFLDDPLTTGVSLQRLFGLTEAARLFGVPSARMADIPVLIQVGGDDSVGGERSALRLANAYRRRAHLSDVRLIVYEGARHEVYNETNRDEVIADTIAFLNEHLSTGA